MLCPITEVECFKEWLKQQEIKEKGCAPLCKSGQKVVISLARSC